MASSESPNYDDLADAELLERFVSARDDAAFAAIVRRHHGLVFGVCRRRLRCRQDAEDAFQATFLVLAQKGHKIRQRAALASWLYGAAYRVALRLSRARAAGAAASLEEPVMVHDDPLRILAERHEQLVTDEELAALPERLRAPLVLRYLAGKSNEEVAAQLEISVAAVEGRLKRAKRKLRRTLIRRGVALSTTLASLGAARAATAQAAEPLVAETVAVCLGGSSALTASGSVGASSASETALKLASKEIYAMTTLKFSNVAAVAVAVVCTASLGLGLRHALSQSPGTEQGQLSLAALGAGGAEGESGAGPVAVADANDPFAAPQGAGPSAAAAGRSSNSETRGAASAGAAEPPPSGQQANDTFDVKPRTEEEIQIRRALREDANIDFFDMPFNEAMSEIARRKNILIEIDRRWLKDAGIDTATPVTASYQGMSLRAALRRILDEIGLTYVIEEEFLLITTPEEAENRLETRLYPTRAQWRVVPEDLVTAITSTVSPESWHEVGGPGNMVPLGNTLVVTQTEQIHEEINDFLRQVEAAAEFREKEGGGRYGSGYGGTSGYEGSFGGYGPPTSGGGRGVPGYGSGGYGGSAYGDGVRRPSRQRGSQNAGSGSANPQADE